MRLRTHQVLARARIHGKAQLVKNQLPSSQVTEKSLLGGPLSQGLSF